MKIWTHNIVFCLMLVSSVACREDNIPESNDPVVNPPHIEETNTIYNGIILPEQWPPRRSSTSDLEKGMLPFYLSSKPDIIDISVGRQLFVDDFLIASTSLKRIYYYPEYSSVNPVLTADKEWEKVGDKGAAFTAPFSDGVWYDEKSGKFKMWYMAGGGSYSTKNAGVMCYAESADGVVWTKPSLPVVNGTNIVDYNSERDASTVWIDKQEANVSKRYKMFLSEKKDMKWQYTYKISSDGITWREVASSKPTADRSTVYKNPFRNVWSYSIRHNVRVRANKLVRARDYSEYSDPVIGTKNAEAVLSSFWFGPWPNELRHPRYHDVSPAIYNLDAVPYESIMLGLFSIWQGPENDICAAENEIKRNQIMVGYSRDGYSWFREDMNPFMAVNETLGAWNYGNLQSVAGTPLIIGDKLYFYLSGRRLTEEGQEVTTTGLATLRRDGFASMKGTGELETPTVKFTGNYFYINANVNGGMKVELLNSDGTVILGYSKNDCVIIKGDCVKQKVEWKSNKTLSGLENRKIKIKFYVTNGELFSFWISPESTGESQGYTAGGGPGLHESGLDKK